jgi:hypothetical protein
MPADVRGLLAQHKPALLEWLSAPDDPEERAALQMPEAEAKALLPAAVAEWDRVIAGDEAPAPGGAPNDPATADALADDDGGQDGAWDEEDAGDASGPGDGPATDAIGIPLDDATRAVFVTLKDFKEVALHGLRLTRVIDRIAKGPYGPLLIHNLSCLESKFERSRWRYESRELRQLLFRIKSLAPFAADCPYCLDQHARRAVPGCTACLGLGVTTKARLDNTHRDLVLMVLGQIPDEEARREATRKLWKKWWA